MKKVLSLVLILAMVLGSFAFTFAGETPEASNFSDYASINQAEAVDVLVATGVINGMPDGTFAPAGAVTRAQMAKMIAVLMNGGEDIGAYYAAACTFTDVDAWAKGYVAYCASKGIVAGRDAKTFDPNANVTAVEAAKMMLVALGYDPEFEGYVGSDWKVNVLKDAKANDLFEDLSIKDYDKALTREEAAQVIFNGMQAWMVGYETKSSINIGGVEITQTSTAKASEADFIGMLYQYAFDGKTGSFRGNAFTAPKDGDLKLKAADGDDFGRPAHTWTFDDFEGTYADAADYTFVVDESQNIYKAVKDFDEDLYDDMAETYTADSSKITGCVNGISVGAFEVYDATSGKYVDNPSAIAKVGDVVEIFESDIDDKDYNKYTIVVSRYHLVQITDVDTEVSKADAKKDIACRIDATGLLNVADIDFPGFDAKTYVEDAFVAVAIGKNKNNETIIIDSYIPEKVTGEVGKFKTDSSATVDGTKYTFIDAGFTHEGFDFGDKPLASENTYNFYLDKNGYVLGYEYESGESTTLYGILTYVEEARSTTAYILDAEGNEVSYKVDKDLAKTVADAYAAISTITAPATAPAVDTLGGVLVRYTIDEDGVMDTFYEANPNKSPNADKLTLGNSNKTVSKTGVLGGYKLSKDVVAYFYDVEEDEWTVYTYDELIGAEFDKTGTYVALVDADDDNAVIAIHLLMDIDDGTANDFIGFYVDVDTYKIKNDNYADITLLVNGAEETYTTVKGLSDKVAAYFINGTKTLDCTTPFAFTLNSNDEISAINFLSKDGNLKISSDGQVEDSWATGAVAYAAYGTVKMVSTGGENFKVVDLEAIKNSVTGWNKPESEFIYAGESTVYRVTFDGTALDKMVKYNGKISEGGLVFMMQTDEDSEVWDTIVYVTPADSSAMKTLLSKYPQ